VTYVMATIQHDESGNLRIETYSGGKDANDIEENFAKLLFEEVKNDIGEIGDRAAQKALKGIGK